MANANYQPQSNNAPYSGDCGNRTVHQDSAVIAANLATTDKVRLCKIPAGTRVDRVVINNPDLDSGATLAVNIGFAHIDGSSGASATAVASAATTWQARLSRWNVIRIWKLCRPWPASELALCTVRLKAKGSARSKRQIVGRASARPHQFLRGDPWKKYTSPASCILRWPH